MSYFVFTNPDKEERARGVVERGGRPDKARANAEEVAECVLYARAKAENPKLDGEDLVLYIYQGLGGRAEEFESNDKAQERKSALQSLRIKQSRKEK